jgi:ABC-type Zn uptake system ZnuABC Zn-binding protein ZnuA
VVVTSLPLFATMVEAVGGDLVAVSAVLPPGTDPHTYQPAPRDVAKLAEAAVVVYNGGDLDFWMERQLEAVGSRARIVVLSEGMEPPPVSRRSTNMSMSTRGRRKRRSMGTTTSTG